MLIGSKLSAFVIQMMKWNFLPIYVGFFGMREIMHGMEKLLHNLLQVFLKAQDLLIEFKNANYKEKP